MKETEKKTKKQYKRTDAPKGQVAQIKRIQHIHNQIANNKFPNCKTLAKELDVSEMTIHRDMDKLRDDFRAPIEFNYTENGFYYYETYEFTLQKTLEENELQLLTEAKIFLSHFKNTPVYEGMEKVLDSFCANRKYEKDDDLLLRRIALAPSTEPRVHINPKTWEDITEALKKNYVLHLHYPKPSDDITEPSVPVHEQEEDRWTVRPYQILLDKGIGYLLGYVEEKKDVRLFDLNKISHLSTSFRQFDLPEKFEIENFTGGGHFGAFKRFRPKQYKIAFYEAARPIIRNGNWADNQKIEEDDENGRTILTFTAAQDMRILKWVFENMAYAEPLEPPSLVAHWKFNIATMAQMAGFKVKSDLKIEDIERMEREGN